MKTKRLDLNNVKNVLSRDQMKKIMAGSGGTCQTTGEQCDNTGNRNCCNKLKCSGTTSGTCASCGC